MTGARAGAARSSGSTCAPRGAGGGRWRADARRDRREPDAAPRRAPVRARRGAAWSAGPIVAGSRPSSSGCSRPTTSGVPLRDPDHVAALYLVLVGFGVVAARRARHRGARGAARGHAPPVAGGDGRACGASAGRRRGRSRRAARWSASTSTYMAYRNLKAIVPLLRPDDIFDRQLADLDRSMFLGHDPADAAAQRCSASGVTTHVLSTFYVAFIVFLPLSLARRARVLARPAGRPASTRPRSRSTGCSAPRATSCCRRSARSTTSRRRSPHLPHSEVTRLQDMLLDQRVEFLIAPDHARRRRASRRSPRCTSR